MEQVHDTTLFLLSESLTVLLAQDNVEELIPFVADACGHWQQHWEPAGCN